MHTAADDITDDSRVVRRSRRGGQVGAGAGGAGSVKRFPQFPPGAAAAAAKAARAGDVLDRRAVSLPVLSNNASTVTADVNDISSIPLSFQMSGHHQQPTPRSGRE